MASRDQLPSSKTKRTSTDKEQQAPRKRVAFTAARSSATKALIAKNAASSLLLQLPLELRRQIWGEVLGDRIIHLLYAHNEKNDILERSYVHSGRYIHEDINDLRGRTFATFDCEAHELRLTSNMEHGAGYTSALWENRVCERQYHEDHLDANTTCRCRDRPINSLETLNLSILCTSRQTYVEANEALWTANMFAFHDALTFKRFIMTRSAHQKRSIRGLNLDMDFEGPGHEYWASALEMRTVKSLQGLKEVRLRIGHLEGADSFDERKKAFMDGRSNFKSVGRLSTLALTSAEVTIEYPPPGRPLHWNPVPGMYWTKEQSAEVADGLKMLLLNPEAANLYAAAEKKIKDQQLIVREERAAQKQKKQASLDALLESFRKESE